MYRSRDGGGGGRRSGGGGGACAIYRVGDGYFPPLASLTYSLDG